VSTASTRRPPLVLLPPSKGKADGGDGPAYAASLGPEHPLTPARREVLDAVVAAVDHLDDPALARLAGVGAGKLDDHRPGLAALHDALTLPAHRRYTGVVHGNARLAEVDPARAAADVRIVSPLLGLAALDEPVPAYRLELTGSLPGLGGLGPYWRDALADHLADLGAGWRVWDLLPGEHARVWPPGLRDDLDVVTVRFVRPDGRAANAARTKVCKGRLAAALLARPRATPSTLARHLEAPLADAAWRLTAEGRTLTAIDLA
jgi:cytoplasmic iron level regulating protein YaaA (DUF328/UPF0246 family)